MSEGMETLESSYIAAPMSSCITADWPPSYELWPPLWPPPWPPLCRLGQRNFARHRQSPQGCHNVLQAQSNEFLSWHFTVPFLRQDVGSCPLSEQGAEHTFLPSTVAPSWADVAGRKGVLSNNTNSSPTARDTAPAHLPSSYNYTGGACRREDGQGSF